MMLLAIGIASSTEVVFLELFSYHMSNEDYKDIYQSRILDE